MKQESTIPSDENIKSVIYSMTGNNPVSIQQLPTGDQNFVFSVSTSESEYVLRMTGLQNKFKFKSAIKWQEILLPLGVPLSEFIHKDIDGSLSPFSSLLMLRLPGNDLINVYQKLSDADKKNIALEIIKIQSLCSQLPKGKGFGILNSYDDPNYSDTWFDFILSRLKFCKQEIERTGVFSNEYSLKSLDILERFKSNFQSVTAKPFLWDASERNVLICNGKISGIVDVDEICFGDSLLVIALTSTCLELKGYDTKYTDYWASNLKLDHSSVQRLNFYRLFYAVAFMRKHGSTTVNQKQILFDIKTLKTIYNRALMRLSSLTN